MQFPIDKLRAAMSEMEEIAKEINALSAKADQIESAISSCYRGGGVGGRSGAVAGVMREQARNISKLAQAADAAASAYLIAQDNICSSVYALSKREYESGISASQKMKLEKTLNKLGELIIIAPKSSRPPQYYYNEPGISTCTANVYAMQLNALGKPVTVADMGGQYAKSRDVIAGKNGLIYGSYTATTGLTFEEKKDEVKSVLQQLPEGKQIMTVPMYIPQGYHEVVVYLDENDHLMVNDPGLLWSGKAIGEAVPIDEWYTKAKPKSEKLMKYYYIFADPQDIDILESIELSAEIFDYNSEGKLKKKTK